jgi:fused signal recognition particle receptor
MRLFRRGKAEAPAEPKAEQATDSHPTAPVDEAPEPAAPDETPAPAPADAAPASAPESPEPRAGLLARLRRGLGKTRSTLSEGLGNLFLGKKTLDDELLEELETRLLMADVGIETCKAIVDGLVQRVKRKELADPQALYQALKEQLVEVLAPSSQPLEIRRDTKPFVILMVGVNGAGKTTTIGKLAKRCQSQGLSVMLAAGDTFRAAAVEQLQIWGERNGVPVVAQPTGSDSASVIFDGLQSARARGCDVLIADTAGRLHVKSNLMEELRKIVRVMQKLDPAAPHEVMLVLDAGTGQNGLAQARHFQEAVGVSGVALTKLDGTAKGGIVFAVSRQLGLPIRFIGIGEGIDDLRPFLAADFVSALFDDPVR